MPDAEPEALSTQAPLALLYHENSKIHRASIDALAESVSDFTADTEEVQRSVTGVKTYPTAQRVALPTIDRLPRPRRRLDRVLRERRTVRDYDRRPISLPLLASLLEHAAGVTAEVETPEQLTQHLRANPSGGALFPVEAYLVAFAVNGLERGIYHYHPTQHCLETVRTGALKTKLTPLILTASGSLDAPALVILTGRWQRPLAKYGERGYRVLLLDAGHLAQNILLVATALELAACPVAGFQDDALAGELELNPTQEPILYAITVGHAAR